MSRLEKLIEQLCPDGVEFKKIKEEYHRLKGTSITAWKMKEIATPDGDIRIFAGGKTVIDAYEKDIPNANITRVPAVLVQSRGVIDAVYYERPFTFKNEMWAYTHKDKVAIKFLYYVLKGNMRKFREAASGMGSLPQISLKVTEDFEMPVPPIEVQREIVRILDQFTELTEELTTKLAAELTARKKQYEYYRDKLFVFSGKAIEKPLEAEFPSIRNGFVGTITSFFSDEEHGVRYLEGRDIHNGTISDDKAVYVTKEFHKKHLKTQLQPDDIVVVQSGHVGECAVVDDKYAGANCHALIVMSNGGNCDSRYVAYYLQSSEGKRKLASITTGGTVKHILASKIKKLSVPFPPIEEQRRIVSILDRFDALCNDLSSGLPAEIEARRKQYEYYRDKLLTFPGRKSLG